MKNDKKRILILMLWLLLGIVIVIIIGYFIGSYLRLNNKRIALDNFKGKTYVTEDGQAYLIFDNDESIVTIQTETTTEAFMIEYEENIFKLSTDSEIYYLIVLDEQTIYGGTGKFYYLQGDNT